MSLQIAGGSHTVPSHIIPVARPDLALTLVTQDGETSLALLPRDPNSRLQMFETAPPSAPISDAAASAEHPRPAPLLQVGAAPAVPNIPADYIAEAHIVDFILAFMKGSRSQNQEAILVVIGELRQHIPLAKAISIAALLFYGIPLDAAKLGTFLSTLKHSTPNKALAAFFKRIHGNAALMHQIMAAGTDYVALAKMITANGCPVSAQDLQSYLAPWQFFAAILTGLKAAGKITQAQYDERIGYAENDYTMTGFGPQVDQSMIYGMASASGWVTKLEGFSDFGLPMQLLMVPISTAMYDSLTGEHNFGFKKLGPMMIDGFLGAFQATADSLQSFGNDLGHIF